MNNLNSILVEGNLVRDPEYRTTPKGTALCKISLACSRFYKQDGVMEKEVSFFDVDSWGKLAETVNQLGKKGRGVRVVGRLKQDRWQNREGKTQTKVYIVAEHVEFRPDFQQNEQNQSSAEEYEEEGSEAETAEAENLVPTF